MFGLTVRKSASITLRDEKKRVEIACHNKQSILRLFNEKNRPIVIIHVYGKEHEKAWKIVKLGLFPQFITLSENGQEYQFKSFRKQNTVVKEMIGDLLSVFGIIQRKKDLISFGIPIPEEVIEQPKVDTNSEPKIEAKTE